MSYIYIQEPRADGKVVLETTVGEIELEFWPKECPKATRNFIQLCLEGYYNDTIFHRVIKDFIVIGGDPTGTGEGGESIYGEPFRDEFHSRLRFNRRGLLAMANIAKNANKSQFFFTLSPATELQNKHTIFGRVVGDSLFNMIKLGECSVDCDERPLHPHRILTATVVENPFKDIVPRIKVISDTEGKKAHDKAEKDEQTSSSSVKKDFKLLSFFDEDDELEEEEQDSSTARIKYKSTHAILNDHHSNSKSSNKNGVADKTEAPTPTVDGVNRVDPDDEDSSTGQHQEENTKKKRMNEIRVELDRIKHEIIDQGIMLQRVKEEATNDEKAERNSTLHSMAADLIAKETLEVYMKAKNIPKKRSKDREDQYLSMMNEFKTEISNSKTRKRKACDNEETDGFLNHKFNVTNDLILAKDANLKTADWYSFDDPRNPVNKRRHEKHSHASSHKSSHGSCHRSSDGSSHSSYHKSSHRSSHKSSRYSPSHRSHNSNNSERRG